MATRVYKEKAAFDSDARLRTDRDRTRRHGSPVVHRDSLDASEGGDILILDSAGKAEDVAFDPMGARRDLELRGSFTR